MVVVLVQEEEEEEEGEGEGEGCGVTFQALVLDLGSPVGLEVEGLSSLKVLDHSTPTLEGWGKDVLHCIPLCNRV